MVGGGYPLYSQVHKGSLIGGRTFTPNQYLLLYLLNLKVHVFALADRPPLRPNLGVHGINSPMLRV
jgi:hypothetical protein